MVPGDTTRTRCNYLGHTILHTLEFCGIIKINIVKEGIAVVESTANGISSNSFSNTKSQIPLQLERWRETFESNGDEKQSTCHA